MRNSKIAATAMLIGTLAFVGCATQRPLFKAPMVSVTEDSVETSHRMENLGPVTARYCPGDAPTDPNNQNVGLLDEVISKAQTEKKARYIKDAQFYTTAGNCVMLEGVALR